MATKYLTPSSSALLSGTVGLVNVKLVSAPTSSAVASSAASYQRVVDQSGSSHFTAAGTASYARWVEQIGASALVAASSASAVRVAYASGGSAFRAFSTARYEGEEMEAWVTHVANKVYGRYANFNFNSFATIGDRTFAFGDGGVFELKGSTDAGAPIPFFLMSASYSKDLLREQPGMLLPYAGYVVGDMPGETAEFFIVTDKDVPYSYPLKETAGELDTRRATLGRGLRGRFIRYGVHGLLTEPLDLSMVTVKFDASKRNV